MGATYPDLYAAVGVATDASTTPEPLRRLPQSPTPNRPADRLRKWAAPTARPVPLRLPGRPGLQSSRRPTPAARARCDRVAADGPTPAAKTAASHRPTRRLSGRARAGNPNTTQALTRRHGKRARQAWIVHGMARLAAGNAPNSTPTPRDPTKTAAMYDLFTNTPLRRGAPSPRRVSLD